jgi:hypothetical protein
MALAALCLKAMSSILDNEQIQFRAFVVDHASRPSSSEESRQVVQILKDNGISYFSIMFFFVDIVRYSESSPEYGMEKPGKAIRLAQF